jgi:hypothetical protein
MNIVRLTATDRGLLCARYVEHGNSHRRMLDALADAGACDAGERLRALRALEHRFDLDLAEICHRFPLRTRDDTHPIERMVMDFIAEEREHDGELQLWVLHERVRQVRELMEGRLVGDLES